MNQNQPNLSTNKKPMQMTTPLLKTKTKITAKLIIGMVIAVAVAVGIGAVIFFGVLPPSELPESKSKTFNFITDNDEEFKEVKDFLDRTMTAATISYAGTDDFIIFNRQKGISLSTQKFASLANFDYNPPFGTRDPIEFSSDYKKCQDLKKTINSMTNINLLDYVNYDLGVLETQYFKNSKDGYAYIPSGLYMREITLGSLKLSDLHNKIFKKTNGYSPNLVEYFKTSNLPRFSINTNQLATRLSAKSVDVGLCAREALRWVVDKPLIMILYTSDTVAYPLPTAYGKTKIHAYFYDKEIGQLPVWVDYQGGGYNGDRDPEIDFGGAVDMRFLQGKAVSKTFSASEFVDENGKQFKNIKELKLKIKTKADVLRGDVVTVYASNNGGEYWYPVKDVIGQINENGGNEKMTEFSFNFFENIGSELKLAFVFKNQKQLSTEDKIYGSQIYPFKSKNSIGKGDGPKFGAMNIDALKTLFIPKYQEFVITDNYKENVNRKVTSKYEIQGQSFSSAVLTYPVKGDYANLTEGYSIGFQDSFKIRANFEGYDQLLWEGEWVKLSGATDRRVWGVVILPDDGTNMAFPLGIKSVEMTIKGDKEETPSQGCGENTPCPAGQTCQNNKCVETSPLNPNTPPDISGPESKDSENLSDLVNSWEDKRKVNPKNNINLAPFKTVLENIPNLIDALKTPLPFFEIDAKHEYRGADRVIVKWKTEDEGIKKAVETEKQNKTEPFELKSLKFKYAQVLNEKKEKAKEGEKVQEIPLNLEEKVYYNPKDDEYYAVLKGLKGGEYYEKTDKDYINGSAAYVFSVTYLEGDKETRSTAVLPFTTLNRLQTILYLYHRIFGEEKNLDITSNMNPKECKGARCDGAIFWYNSGLTFEGIKYAIMHDPLKREFISRFDRTVSEKGSLWGVERLFSTIHDRIYPEDLAKVADLEGMNYWRGQIDSKKISWDGVISYFFLSPEYNKNLIVSQGLEKTLASFSYLTTLGRPGVEKDLEWLKQQYGANSKEMRREILGDFIETKNKQTGEVAKNFQFKKEPKVRIEKIDKEVGRDQALGYLYLGVLSRPIDPDGLKFYKEKMEKEGLTFEQVAQALFESKEFKKFGEPAFAKEAMGEELE